MDTLLQFTKFVKKPTVGPSKTQPQDNSWNNMLENVINAMQKTDEQLNLVGHSFWKHLFAKFQKYHFNQDEKLQFLQLLTKLIKANFGLDTIEDQVQFCGESGAKFHKLQNSLHFKHEQSLDYQKFMASRLFHRQLSTQLLFPDLNFDLSMQETEKVASKVRGFCSNNLDSFAFLSLYIQISVKKKALKEPLGQVQQEYLAVLDHLAKKYPPNEFQLYPQGQNIKLENIRTSHEMQRYFFENDGTTRFDQLKQLIIKKAENAKKDHNVFQKLVKEICYIKGYSFKSGVKIKSPQNMTSILRTIQKLIQEFLEKDNQAEKNSDQSDLIKREIWKNFFVNDFKSLIEGEKQNSYKKIQSVLQKQRAIVFDSKDLVRGKCTFSTIEDIVLTVKLLSQHITRKGYQIIEIKDRLSKGTKDAVLIIKLPDSVAELQLVVKLDSVANEFNHKIYELKRSKLYTPITNLFILNQIWCQNFFVEQIELLEGLQKIRMSRGIQWSPQFKEFKYDLQDFIKKFLEPNEITYTQENKLKEEAIIQIAAEVNILLNIIKSNQYVNVNKLAREEYQKVYEVKFMKENTDYEKGLQLIYCLQSGVEQSNTLLLKLKGDILCEKAKFQQAFKCYFRCQQLYENGSKSQSQSLIYASVLNQIGLVHERIGNHAQSLEYFRKCLQTKTKIKGQNSIDLASILNNMGSVYETKGEYAKALEHYQRCLAIKMNAHGKESIEVATTFNNIGSVYERLGKFSKALEYYERCLDIKSKVKGKDSMDVATTLNNMGSVYDNVGNFTKALECFQKCLNIKRKIKGTQSIDVATSLNNIGVTMEHKGDYNSALDYYQQSLNIQIKVKGQNSIDAATTMNNIGLVYANSRQYADSLEYFEKSFEIQKYLKGQHSMQVAAILNNFGFVYDKQKNYDKALQNYQKSLNIEIKMKGQNSIDVATPLNNIGSVYYAKKDYNKCLEYYQKCLKIHQNIGEKNSIEVATILNNIGLIYNQKGDLNQALECFEKCLAIKAKTLGENSIDVAMTLNNLSFLYEKMKLLQKSQDCAKKSYSIREKVLGPGHQYTQGTLRQLQKIERLLQKLR